MGGTEHVVLAQCGDRQGGEGTIGLAVPFANGVQDVLSGNIDHLLRLDYKEKSSWFLSFPTDVLSSDA